MNAGPAVGLEEATLQQLRDGGDPPTPLVEDPRRCLLDTCRAVLVRREAVPGGAKREEARRWLGRQFCNHLCAMRHVRAQKRIGVGQEKTCPGCGVVFGWPDEMPLGQWNRKRFCTRECGTVHAPAQGEGQARHRRKARPASKPAASPVLAVPAVPSSGPAVIWRPAGFSRIPNAMAGHRPPEPDPIDEVAS